MEIVKAKELSQLASHLIDLANQYSESRKRAGFAKADLELLITANMNDIIRTKKNVGYEMSILIFLQMRPEFASLYETWRKEEENYRALEKLIDAHQTKLSVEQSIMKYILKWESNAY